VTAIILGCLSALWLGVLTALSPCPMATNIAAISFVGRRVGNAWRVLLAGLLYTLGRTLAYVVLGSLVVASVLSKHAASEFVQGFMNQVLGPILIVAGMFLVELITISFTGRGVSDKMRERVERWGVWGAALLGVVFALSFCPISAFLFFTSLLTLAARTGSTFLVPALFGVGTALPVVAFSVVIALSAKAVGGAFKRVSQFEWWARRATGVIFILVGIYYSLAYIWGVTL
jgi:cytochrome c-type biogenesis protein